MSRAPRNAGTSPTIPPTEPGDPAAIESIIQPVPKETAVGLAEIHAIRGLTDAVSGLTRHIERIGGRVEDVRERVIKLEAKETDAKLAEGREKMSVLERRLNELESIRDQQKGAVGLVDWLRQTTPWLLAIGGAMWAVSQSGNPVG